MLLPDYPVNVRGPKQAFEMVLLKAQMKFPVKSKSRPAAARARTAGKPPKSRMQQFAQKFLPALSGSKKTAMSATRQDISADLQDTDLNSNTADPAFQFGASRQMPDHQPRSREGVLLVSGLEKAYKGRRVVRGVDLGVRRGEAVGLLGPNGAGKTTCFYMITGLVQADAGRIDLDGHDITQTPMYQRARLGIGYLPQEASIFRGLSVENNIRAVLEVVESDKKERERRLDALLEEFHIAHLRKSPSIALSGGERRRCEIARALATKPSFMLLDEPFAGVDPIAVGDIQELVRHLTRRGIGVLITDHNVRETLGLIDRAYIINEGRVLTHGSPDQIVSNTEVRRTYLGEQFTL